MSQLNPAYPNEEKRLYLKTNNIKCVAGLYDLNARTKIFLIMPNL